MKIMILLSALLIPNMGYSSATSIGIDDRNTSAIHSTKHKSRKKQIGKASFYSYKFNHKRTANGERFNPLKLTAAHRTLPFNTKVRVTNLTNKKTIIVRINDRGPYIGNRIIDLSLGAARIIGIDGVSKVSIEILDT